MRIFFCLVFTCLCSIFKLYAQVNLNNGLMAYYPFDGNPNDVSGNNNNPVFNNATLTTDRNGQANKAYYFNGVNNYMQIPNAPTINGGTQISLCAWVKPMGFYQGPCHGNSILMKGDGDFLPGNYDLRFDDAQYTAANCSSNIVDEAHENFYSSLESVAGGYSPYIQKNTWYSVIATYDGNRAKLYVNCNLVADQSLNGQTFTNDFDLFFGRLNNDQYPYWFNGALDDIRIYNRAITQDEVNVIAGCQQTQVVTPSFTVPDTVCVNSPVNITNTTTGASRYYWNFCTADINSTKPSAVDLGNPGNKVNRPVFIDVAYQNGKYYGFLINNGVINSEAKLIRLDFGTSMLNTPSAIDMGTFNGAIPNSAEGIQMVQNNNKWYAIIVGGAIPVGSTPSILKIDFGSDVTNLSPVATNWGNIGNLSQPIDLFVFQQGTNWYGLTVNANNNTITRFNFGSSFDNTPTADNLGNIGGLNYPTGVYAINDNGFWRVFITNGADYFDGTGASLTRLDFGSSLLNTPTGVNLGNPGGLLHEPRDITILKLCGETVALVVNGYSNDIVKLDFSAGLTTPPSAVSFNTLGNLNFPHSLSKIFRVGADLYSLIPNVNSSVLTRIQFTGCTNVNILNSTDKTPANVTYNKPGVYNINLSVDDGLATQSSICKQVVVLGPPNVTLSGDSTACLGDSAHITASGGVSYSWLPTTGVSNPNNASVSIKPTATTKYYVTAKNSTGCAAKDSVTITAATCAVCNTWLNIPDIGSSVRIGDLDVTGNQITVEANFTRTQPYNGNRLYAGDIVSKHRDPSDANYLLRPNSAEITTTSGYYVTPEICEIELNKMYHVALVYDGKTLKFYRNGFLMSETAAAGNLVQNNWITTIGNYAYDPTGNTFVTALLGYIDNVRIWKVARTQDEIKQYMNTTLPNPATQAGLVASYTFDNLSNKQGNTQWNGSFTGNAKILADNPTCPLYVADSCGQQVVTCNVSADFSFIQDVCNPKQLQFTNETQNVSSVAWDFGNGQTAGNVNTTAVIYNIYNSYNVKLAVKTANGCVDTVTKNIAVNVENADIITTADTLLCNGTSLQLNAVPGLNYCWTPAAGLSATNIANPVANVTGNITYRVTSQTLGKNLIVNGDFSQGNTGFTSGYTYANPNVTEGQYFVGTNPTAWNPGTSGCSDHTGNNGNMMLVNGNPQDDLQVWSETIAVQPNTNYAFSAWLTPIYGVNPAELQFYINGKTIGNVFTAQLPMCSWQQFYQNWNSGDTSKVTISIINKNTIVLGNDFALDDISFAQSFIKTDSVNIKLGSASVQVSPDTSICAGGSAKITANLPPNSTYSWSPSTGLSSTSSASPVASPGSTTTYLINVLSSSGCKLKDSVTVNVLPQPSVTTIADTAICSGSPLQLSATAVNGATYSWSPAAGLSDPSQQDPVATPTGTTQYIVTVNPGATCFAKDTVNVSVKPLPQLSVSNDTSLCSGTAVQLAASSPDNVTYSWAPSATLNDNSISNPVASPAINTKYYVQAGGANGCNNTDSVVVNVIPQPTVATIADTAICGGSPIQLTTNTVNGNAYSWSPAAGLSDASSQNPLASPVTNTQYIITVNPGSLCIANDTVNIVVNQLPVVQASGDTTLCIGASSQVIASSQANVIYSWSPVAGLSDPAISNPVASPSATTIYTVQVTDVNKCNGSASVIINVIPQPVFGITPLGKTICIGDELTLTASGGDAYQWSPVETVQNPSAASTVVKPLRNTTYQVIITSNTCKINDTAFSSIIVNDKLATTISKSNDVDCVQGSANLVATGGNQYAWTPADNMNQSNIANPVVTPLTTTTYYVTVTKNGCKATDSITVVLSVANADYAYKMPSAFTPNGDGLNDCFGLKYWGGIKSLSFEVYNRWGNRLFYTTDPSKCWDGRFKGQVQPGGTYVYQIRASTICGEIYKKGTIVLIR